MKPGDCECDLELNGKIQNKLLVNVKSSPQVNGAVNSKSCLKVHLSNFVHQSTTQC